MAHNKVLDILVENPEDVFEELIRILRKIADNVLRDPTNSKFRILQKNNATIRNKILCTKGGSESLKLMGFEENTTSFIMPQNVPISTILEFKKVLTDWVNLKNCSISTKPASIEINSSVPISNITTSDGNEKIIHRVELPHLVYSYTNPYLRNLETYSHTVLQYENKILQERSKKLIPIEQLETDAQNRLRNIQEHVKKNKLDDPDISIQDTLLLSLLRWFKEDFFEWVDSPVCERCDGQTSFSHMSTDPKLLIYTDRVELHKCKSCSHFTPFARYNDPNILLETRKGRCGEWANTFTLLCRAMGWDARFVVCEGDHVWTEVYSITQKRWMHCDPCENICDTPLVYEQGWNKQISYVISYSAEEIQDVTWRYSSNHKEVLKRRNKCTETELLDAILSIRTKLLKDKSTKRKEYLAKRTVLELVEFLQEKKPGEEDQKGRTSGATIWRLARNEISTVNERKYIWLVNSNDIVDNTVIVKYSAALNRYEYISGNRQIKEVIGWNEGAYECNKIFRKEETDWNMVYLARNVNDDCGRITWKIDLSNTNQKLHKVSLNFKFQTFENGVVDINIESQYKSFHLPTGETAVTTDMFADSKWLILEARLTGGRGDVAWQHSQLFRQSLNDTTEYPLSIVLTFR